MAVAIAMAASLAVIGLTAAVGRTEVAPSYALTALPPPDATTSATPTPTPTPTATAAPRARCPISTSRPFVPRYISVKGVTRRATVIAPPRTADRVPGAPPLTAAGKEMFAWDRAQRIRAGERRGHMLLNAHVWPDGSAVGNRLLAGLQVGERIVVHGRHKKLCYRVIERIQVYPWQGIKRYYNAYGRHRLALVVCSGRRLGPGRWEKRTIWYAALKP